MDNVKTILLVEDDALIALSEAADLRKEGYNVILASGGPKAIETVRSRPGEIDLILMDIDLGRGMDGTEAAMAPAFSPTRSVANFPYGTHHRAWRPGSLSNTRRAHNASPLFARAAGSGAHA